MEGSQQAPLISRIAPTPSGYLHKGNAFSFVLTWLLTRKMGGRLILRIDDSDASRSRPEYVEDIFYTLDWLGLDYDIGPDGPDAFDACFSQRHRLGMYESFLEDLKNTEGLVYACSCSRKEIRQQNDNGLYKGGCRSKALAFSGKNIAWRVHVPEQTDVCYREWLTGKEERYPLSCRTGDFVVRRKDGLPAYQLVSLADDIFYGVNFIVRGSDLCGSTAAQIYLARCLGAQQGKWQTGAQDFAEASFFHHPLILNNAGEKLSKSKGAASVHFLRESGREPQEIYREVARFCGVPDAYILSLPDLLDAVSLDVVQGKI